jgi:hypothetical protein
VKGEACETKECYSRLDIPAIKPAKIPSAVLSASGELVLAAPLRRINKARISSSECQYSNLRGQRGASRGRMRLAGGDQVELDQVACEGRIPTHRKHSTPRW